MRAVGVCIPARDEQHRLGAALRAVDRAARHRLLEGRPIRVAVVLDGCSDETGAVADRFVADFRGGDRRGVIVERPAGPGNVGAARREGMAALLADLGDDVEVWLSSTDADTVVPPGWLAHQVAARVEAWAGTVTLGDVTGRAAEVRERFVLRYPDRRRRPVHGASLGVAAPAYLRAGGFPAWQQHEDRGLWRRLVSTGARTLHDPGCPVVTSGRRTGRAPGGFAGWLDRLERAAGPGGAGAR